MKVDLQGLQQHLLRLEHAINELLDACQEQHGSVPTGRYFSGPPDEWRCLHQPRFHLSLARMAVARLDVYEGAIEAAATELEQRADKGRTIGITDGGPDALWAAAQIVRGIGRQVDEQATAAQEAAP